MNHCNDNITFYTINMRYDLLDTYVTGYGKTDHFAHNMIFQ